MHDTDALRRGDPLGTFGYASNGEDALGLQRSKSELPNGKTKQWIITPRDGHPIPLGVIFERWTHRTEGELLCFVMVTTPVSTQLSRMTDRMPYVVQPDHWAKWLGEAPASTAELKAMLVPFEGDWRIEPSPLRGSNRRAFDPKKEPTLL